MGRSLQTGSRTVWTFVLTSVALFMVVLDNLVVSTAVGLLLLPLATRL